MSNEGLLNELVRDIEHAKVVRSFMLSDTGKVFAEQIEVDLSVIKDRLLDVNAGDSAKVLELQADGRALQRIKSWLLSVVDRGDEADFQINDQTGHSDHAD